MDLLEKIRLAGVTGCGGAGFPTHIKYNTQVEHLILNGVECEPLLRTDRYIMLRHASEILRTAAAVGEFLGAKQITVALKHNYIEEIRTLKQEIQKMGYPISLFEMKSIYPAGDEQVIVYEVTGRVVPPSGIPLDVGCVVSNVATMLAVSDAMENRPFTDKYLTVTGNVKQPRILQAPLGTSLKECIDMAGGSNTVNFYGIIGGPMMGELLSAGELESAALTKTTSGIIVLPADHPLIPKSKISLRHILNRAKSSCIQCSFCSQMCPRYLLGHPLEPHKIMRLAAMGGDLEEQVASEVMQSALICSECGVCEVYACPMGLQPRQVIRQIKGMLREKGIRYLRRAEVLSTSSEREYRKVPSRRLASRLGFLEWYESPVPPLQRIQPDQVGIALKGSLGAAALAEVKPGDLVKKGECIASVEKGALGALVHASIDGVVLSVDGEIVIEGRKTHD